jgi:hypothetical protein
MKAKKVKKEEESFSDPFMQTLNEWKDARNPGGVDFSESTKLRHPMLDDSQTKLIQFNPS